MCVCSSVWQRLLCVRAQRPWTRKPISKCPLDYQFHNFRYQLQVTHNKMPEFNAVSHVIFDMDGLLLGNWFWGMIHHHEMNGWSSLVDSSCFHRYGARLWACYCQHCGKLREEIHARGSHQDFGHHRNEHMPNCCHWDGASNHTGRVQGQIQGRH